MNHSEDEQALIKIQHDWAEARMKGDSSYTQRLEAENCTVVWPDGSIVNKREDLKSMTGDIVFTEFKVDDLQVRLYGDTGIVVGTGHDQGARRKTKSSRREICVDGHLRETAWYMEGSRVAG
jgi:ketosteroid isomerase-like protein